MECIIESTMLIADINGRAMLAPISGMRTPVYRKLTDCTEALLCGSHHHGIQTHIYMISI